MFVRSCLYCGRARPVLPGLVCPLVLAAGPRLLMVCYGRWAFHGCVPHVICGGRWASLFVTAAGPYMGVFPMCFVLALGAWIYGGPFWPKTVGLVGPC